MGRRMTVCFSVRVRKGENVWGVGGGMVWMRGRGSRVKGKGEGGDDVFVSTISPKVYDLLPFILTSRLPPYISQGTS